MEAIVWQTNLEDEMYKQHFEKPENHWKQIAHES